MPVESYTDLNWVSSDVAIVHHSKSGQSGPGVAAELQLSTGSLMNLNLPPDPNCTLSQYVNPYLMSDGRLLLIQWCEHYRKSPSDTTVSRRGERFAMSFDLQSDTLSKLITAPLNITPPFHEVQINATTFDPRFEVGFAATKNGFCERVALVTDLGTEPPPIKLVEGGQIWDLADEWTYDADTCATRGMSREAKLSPDGQMVAIFASPEASKWRGSARLDSPFNLYLVNWTDKRGTLVLQGLRDVRALEWSPDGGWLAFSAKDAQKTPIKQWNTLWLYEIKTGKLIELPDVWAEYAAWSPDGQRLLVAVKPQEAYTYENELRIVDVSETVSHTAAAQGLAVCACDLN